MSRLWELWLAHPTECGLAFIVGWFTLCFWWATRRPITADDLRTQHGVAIFLGLIGMAALVAMIGLTEQYRWAMSVLP